MQLTTKRYLAFTVLHLMVLTDGFSQMDGHRIASINRRPDRTVSLELAGSVPVQFRSYFDLYVVEVANSIDNWSFLATLLRTNNLSDRLIYLDQELVPDGSRFYRTLSQPQVTPFPKPTGSYPVGTTSLLLTDPVRTNRYGVSTNSSFMVTLWYPARPRSGAVPARYVDAQLVSELASLYGMSQSVLANFSTSAFRSMPIATNAAPYPVVIYSHGFKVNRRDNTAKCEELASHGYVVVAPDHADCLGTVFPDNRTLRTSVTSLSASLFENDLMDVRFVLETLTGLNQDDTPFRGVLDLQRIGTMGWSYGGGVAAEICRTDARVQATVLLEAYLQNAREVAWLGIQKPVLGMYHATSLFTTPFDQTARDAYWMRIQGTVHQHFADWRGWLSSPTISGRRAAVAMNACLVAFFDKHLKNLDNHLLDDPSAVYPEVSDFVKK